MTPQEAFFVQLVRERALVPERDLELALRLREERGPGASIPDLLVGLGCLSVAQRESLLAETRPFRFCEPTTDTPTIAGVADTAPAATPGTPAPVSAYPGYEILEEIAHGGMGIVYKARHTALGRMVALKVLIAGEHASPDMLDRFQRESRAAARLDHPHIVHVYDAARSGNVHFFTMRLVDGHPLSHLARAKPLPPRRALEIARTVALALDYAHGQGIIHRDVKPGNILIDAAGEPHVADFGLAKDASTHGATMSVAALGTPSYASPEQVAGQRDRVDARTDVYGLGATLYEMLTGRPPFVGDSVFTVIADVLGREPTPPRALNPNLHRDIETICLKAMEKSPSRRYASAAAMAEDIRRYLDGEPILARPVSRGERLARAVVKHRVVALLGLVVVLLAGGWVGWWDMTASERAMERERTRAAEEALDKAQRVSRVLARWARLAEDVRRIEGAAYDPSLAPEARRARVTEPWLRVQAFLAETPDDPASRAAARALAGWARLLAEGQEAGFAEFHEAASIDPDVPYAWLFEGLARFCRLVEALPLPTLESTPSGIRAGAVPPETAEQAAEREEVRRLLGRARRATVWGKEGAEGLSAASDAVVAMHDGDWARVEACLSRAVETPDLRIAESGLLLARARARYLRGNFAGAQEDLNHVLRARPDSPDAGAMLERVRLAQAAEQAEEEKR